MDVLILLNPEKNTVTAPSIITYLHKYTQGLEGVAPMTHKS